MILHGSAHLQAQALMLTLGAKIAHRLAHCGSQRQWRASGVSKVAITASPTVFTDGPSFGRDNLLQQP